MGIVTPAFVRANVLVSGMEIFNERLPKGKCTVANVDSSSSDHGSGSMVYIHNGTYGRLGYYIAADELVRINRTMPVMVRARIIETHGIIGEYQYTYQPASNRRHVFVYVDHHFPYQEWLTDSQFRNLSNQILLGEL